MGGTVYPARFHCPNNRHLPLPPPAAGGQKEDDFLMEHNIPELVAQLTANHQGDQIVRCCLFYYFCSYGLTISHNRYTVTDLGQLTHLMRNVNQ